MKAKSLPSLRELFSLAVQAAVGWRADGAMRLSASLAFYAVFSLAPLLVIVISIAGLLFGEEAARGQIMAEVSGLAGPEAGRAIQSLVRSASAKSTGMLAMLTGLALVLFGASTVFAELKTSLNVIWGVVVKPGRAFFTLARDRFLSFSLVLAIGFLLLVSLVVSATLAALSRHFSSVVTVPPEVWQGVDVVISIGVISLLFALIFKTLPNVIIGWRDVWIGAAATALLFTCGKQAIGYYIGTSGVASSFGAAGSVVVILVWVNYSACILFFGAEFTKAYAARFGSGIVPNKRAMLLADATRAKPGLPVIQRRDPREKSKRHTNAEV